MSIYFIHAEAIKLGGAFVEKISHLIEADSAAVASSAFLASDAVIRAKERSLRVVIDKFERVE
jgi:hypothetical protein